MRSFRNVDHFRADRSKCSGSTYLSGNSSCFATVKAV